jgi:hypothetical protein
MFKGKGGNLNKGKKMKTTKLTVLSVILLIAVAAIIFFKTDSKSLISRPENEPFSTGDIDDPQARLEQEHKMLRDIITNKIPDNIFNLEQKFASRLPKALETDNSNSLNWTERGPNNVGGRTRALACDVSNANVIIAGGISGGIWRSVNSGSSWSQTTTNSQLHSATCIAQDRRAGQTSNWYVGTGEWTGNSAGQPGSGMAFTGNGVYKSTDNGLSWSLIPSTSGIPPSSFTSDWQYVWNLATDVSNTSQDEVYAATVGSIYRSSDGGTSWTQVLGSSTNRSEYTDVTVNPSGVVYAAGSFNAAGPMNGIRRSTDGISWTDITPTTGFPSTYGRIVLALAPSNPNVVYVGVQGVPAGFPNSVNGHMLYKYTYISGNGTGTGGMWESRGANLPQSGQNNYGTFNEPFDTQGGYDFFMCVKPDNENFLIVNAVNMYVSTDGFATTANARRVAGYQPTQENGTYPNHHPDIHSGFFRPGNTVEFFSGHDGGISRTSDITSNLTTSNPVDWQSLNNGYNVTQFYGISIAPEAGNNRLAGGYQDNGSYMTTTATLSTPWSAINSGDGGFCAIPPAGDDRIYSSSQNGELQRTNFDQSNYSSLKPTGSTNPQFINPLVLDKNNSSLLYFGGGNSATTTGIWRNNNLQNGTNTVGWTYLAGTDFGSTTAKVSTISISRANNPNVVYYGSDEGHIRRITNANGSFTVSGNLNTGLPAGYVSCIAVDPSNSNFAMAVFSNYNMQSLWYTNNGGTSWTDVEGNLSGVNGPSIRWAEIFYINNTMQIMLSTSTGMYFTSVLNGSSTVWTQQAVSSIGNVVCVQTDFRPADNTLVVATHGRGSFQTVITEPISVQQISTEVPSTYSLNQNYPNPFNPSTVINFTLPKAGQVSLKVYDVTGREVQTIVNKSLQAGKYETRFDGAALNSGVYFYKLVTDGFTQTKRMILIK